MAERVDEVDVAERTLVSGLLAAHGLHVGGDHLDGLVFGYRAVRASAELIRSVEQADEEDPALVFVAEHVAEGDPQAGD